jgi:hypothetical protein
MLRISGDDKPQARVVVPGPSTRFTHAALSPMFAK